MINAVHKLADPLRKGGMALAVGFGLHWAWFALLHYAYMLGSPENMGTQLAASVSVVDAMVLGGAFLLARRGYELPRGPRWGLAGCVMASLGAISLAVNGLQFFVPLLIGATAAWFRLGYAEHLAATGGRGVLSIGVVASVVCAILFALVPMLPFWMIVAVTAVMPVGFTALLYTAGRGGSSPAVKHRRKASFPDYSRVAALAFVFSALIEITETNLVYGREGHFLTSLPLGFAIIAGLLLVAAVSFPREGEIGENIPFGAMVVCSLLCVISFCLSPISANTQLLIILQIVGGWGLVAVLHVTLADMTKTKNLRASLIFGIVFFCQRVGNGFGELAAAAITARWGSSTTAHVVITLLMACGFASIVMMLLFTDSHRAPRLGGEEEAPEFGPSGSSRLGGVVRYLGDRHDLSPREKEVLALLLEDRSTNSMQYALHVSENTLKTHTQHIYRKVGVHSRKELVDLAADLLD